MDLSAGGFVLAASTADLGDEPAARDHADAVEFRLDLAADPLAELSDYDGELPVLATNRVADEGGEAPAGPDRLETLARAVDHPAVAAVDLELSTLRDGSGTDLRDRAQAAGVDVLVSVHDFEATPSKGTMRDLLVEACGYGDAGKLATMAREPRDVVDLLAVTEALTTEGRRVATMAMGEPGRHSRAVAPLYGSVLGYAPVDPADATAPGQYDLRALAELVDRLGGPRTER